MSMFGQWKSCLNSQSNAGATTLFLGIPVVLHTRCKSNARNILNYVAGEQPICIAIHGGAGNVSPGYLTEERITRARNKLDRALDAGYVILQAGGSALDAVEASVRILESSRWFNAGKGSTANEEGRVECDASIMWSVGGTAGACAGVRTVKHPITLARCIMEKSPHVLLIADGAEEFAIQQGLEQVTPNEWFYNMRNSSVTHPTMWNLNYRDPEPRGEVRPGPEEKYGTVGAVALDSNGHLAAATSTGGTSKKLKGRVGDSPIIGSGTWADSNCAVSCTGKGEIFIRQAVAHDLAARIKYARQTLEYASKEIIQEKLPLMVGGEGGLISVDKDGNLSLEFNTTVMFRGSIDSNGNKYIAVGR